MEPLISIITVTYNAEATLERTLRSIEEQTVPAALLEHVIVDGASTDHTLAIAQAYKERNDEQYPIEIVSEKDRGLYDAMNKGLKMVHGRFVVALNAGDRLHGPTALEAVADTSAQCPDAGLIYGHTDIVDDDGLLLRPRRLAPPDEGLTWKSFKKGMLVCHQSFYARRELCGDYNLKYRFSADFDWCVRLMHRAEKRKMPLVSCRAILTDYLEEGMTTKNHKASLMERFRIMTKHYGIVSTVLYHCWFILRALFSAASMISRSPGPLSFIPHK